MYERIRYGELNFVMNAPPMRAAQGAGIVVDAPFPHRDGPHLERALPTICLVVCHGDLVTVLRPALGDGADRRRFEVLADDGVEVGATARAATRARGVRSRTAGSTRARTAFAAGGGLSGSAGGGAACG